MATVERTGSIEFEPFFRERYPRLVTLGTTMTGRRDVAQEVAQEALLRAHQRWDEIAVYDNPGAWVKRVAVNLLIDHLRASSRERDAIARVDSRAQSSTPGEVDLAVDRWVGLLAGLSERQRAIVTLFYADDQSVEAIAQLMGIATGTVKAQLFKAREKIRARLAADEETT